MPPKTAPVPAPMAAPFPALPPMAPPIAPLALLLRRLRGTTRPVVHPRRAGGLRVLADSRDRTHFAERPRCGTGRHRSAAAVGSGPPLGKGFSWLPPPTGGKSPD